MRRIDQAVSFNEAEEVSSWQLSGVTFSNQDGTLRQDEIERCLPGESVALFHEPENEHDDGAVAVLSSRGTQIGYLSRDDASYLLYCLGEGQAVGASIEAVFGGTATKPTRGVMVEVRFTEASGA